MTTQIRSAFLAFAAGFTLFATPLGALAETVAKIGDTEYADLPAAVSAAITAGGEQTIDIVADVDLSSGSTLVITGSGTDATKITFNLPADYTVTLAEGNENGATKGMTISAATVTFTGAGTWQKCGNAKLCSIGDSSAANVVFEGGTFKHTAKSAEMPSGIFRIKRGTMTVKGGAFTTAGSSCLLAEAEGSEVGMIVIEGGSFESTYSPNDTGLTVYPVYADGGTVTIAGTSGAKFKTQDVHVANITGTVATYVESGYQLVKDAEGWYEVKQNGYATSGTAAVLPTAPDMSGTIVNVTAAQAQYVLDGAYGAIGGKTINFTESITDTLILGRASKYAGSGTIYRHGSFGGTAMTYADFIDYKSQSGWTESCYYERTVENVTFTANDGVTVKCFEADGGAHVYGSSGAPAYDYVRDTGTWVESSCYYMRATLRNITFKGLTFTAKTDINTSENTTVFDAFTFKDCTFNIGSTEAGNQAIRYYNENNNGNVKNLVVDGCTFKTCYQGVYTHHVKNIMVTNCTFETTGHNAIAVQDSGTDPCDHGEVVITGNIFKGIGDRIIRFNNVGTGTTITIANNTADDNSGDLDATTGKRDIVKATALPEGNVISAYNNNWGTNALVADAFADCVAKIGDTEYADLSAALAAVGEGKPLTWVSDTAWPESTPVYYGGAFYAATDTKGALELAIDAANEANSSDIAKIYVRPGFEADKLVKQAHQSMKTSLAIYGNNATLSQSWEPCVEHTSSAYHQLTKDISLAIYNLHGGAGFWGIRATPYTVNVTMADCNDVHEVLLNGQSDNAAKSVNNYTIKRCTFNGSSRAAACPVTTTSAGTVVVEGCTFANLADNYVVNLNNKNGGKMVISVTDCTFTNCGTSGKGVVRISGEADGSEAEATLSRLTFDEASTANAIYIGKKESAENKATVSYMIDSTAGTLSVYTKGATSGDITATTTTLSSTGTYSGDNLPFVAQIGETKYKTVDAAMEAAAASGTATTVTLLADSTDSTVVPTWYIKNDITIDAESPVKATISPTVNAEGVGDSVGGLAYLTSADASNVRTVTVGENVTLSFPCAKDGLNAFYIGRNGDDAFVPVNLVLNGCIEAYIPYLGAQSTLTISKTGSLKAEWNECLQTRWGSSLTVTGTDGGWSKEKPQVSLSYVNQRGGEITFKDTFVKIGLTWGGDWTINNSNNKTDCATKLTLDNTSLDGISRFEGAGTSAYEIELKNNAKLTIKTDYAGSAGSGFFKNVAVGVVKIEAGSLITAVSVENAGTFVINAAGITEATKVFDYTGTDTLTLESYGTVEVTGGTAYVEDNDLWVKPTVAQIGTVGYASLAEAIAAAKEGETIKLLADVANTDYTVANVVDIKLAKGVSLDGNGKTISGNVKVTVASEGGVTIRNATFKDIHNAAAVSDSYKTKYGFSDDKVGTLSAIYSSNLSGSLTITGCTFENADWESMQITPAPNALIEIRDNVFKTSTSDVVKEQLRYVHIEMAWGSDYDHEGQNITLTVTDNQFLGDQVDSLCLWWAGKGSTLNLSGNYLGKPDSVSVTLSDAPSTGRENRSDLAFPARSQADVDTDDLQPIATIVSNAYNQKFYATLAAAFAAAKSGDTVTLLADLTEPEESKSIPYIIYDMAGVTFDLNGHTYSSYNSSHAFQGTGGVIKNGSMVCLDGGSYALFIGDEGETTSFTVTGVTMTGGVNIYNASGVVLEGLSYVGTNYYSVWLDEYAQATIKDGNYTSAGKSVLNVDKGSVLTVEGGTFVLNGKPLMGTSGGTLAISGGTFTATADEIQNMLQYVIKGRTLRSTDGGSTWTVAPIKGTLIMAY